MNTQQQQIAARKFAEFWKGKGYEKGESQPFWLSLLTNVLDVQNAEKFIRFEEQVKLDHASFIDGYIDETHVMIEQKSIDKDLRKPMKQSDGSLLTPFQQAKRYAAELPYSQRPRWIVTCNFKEFLVYDMENPNGEPISILLENLPKEYYRLSFLVETENLHLKREMEVSIQAGEIVGVLYDEILKQYKDPENEHSLKSLNMLCVRLVFCLYAEDAGIFGKRSMFHDYLSRFEARDLRKELIGLFRVLDTEIACRDPYLDEELAAFPYVNGGLFADENIEIPQFTEHIKQLILQKASYDFDWSEISPTIFGAVFESTLNPVTRRSGGMHYTSIENIHKVINPLFLDKLKEEFSQILEVKQQKAKRIRLEEFRTKLSNITFLDPACGSGNFLTETYLSLRRLENEAIKAEHGMQIMLNTNDIIKVSIAQFYGIEINDFAVTVAKTALWIAESQMMKETEEIVQADLDFLPLKSYTNITEGNALRLDWESLVPKEKLNYIMGNPPFVGAMMMSQKQHEELKFVFPECKKIGEADYVSGWYAKTSEYIINTKIECAFVSTNSISQGQSVEIVWKPLLEKYNIHINFAYRTFRWDSESNSKAHVHCVIIGFSRGENTDKKFIYDGETITEAKNINPYLIDAPNVCVSSRSKPLSNVPPMYFGSMPRDGGGFIIKAEERNDFIKQEPLSEKWIFPYIGSEEFINKKQRYCLWLVDANPKELRLCKNVMERIEKVRNFRASSKAAATRIFSNTPTLFCQIAQPKDDYIIVPCVSSERRRYIPIGFLSPDVIASNSVQIIPSATLYHFGILTSSVHMAWMRAVCGRLKSDYRYSKDIVYNNFPWPEQTPSGRGNDPSPDPLPSGRGNEELRISPSPDGEGRERSKRGESLRGGEIACSTANRVTYKYLKEVKRDLKSNPTEAESKLWMHLRKNQLGYRFRRQHIIDNFIVDFVCLEKKVVIEVDGEIHDQQQDHDSLRTQRLNELGFKVLRFTNEEVLTQIDSVKENILQTLLVPPSQTERGQGEGLIPTFPVVTQYEGLIPTSQTGRGSGGRVEETAQAILDARAKYPDCSLADLYDDLTMPAELRKAHQENDKAVMQAYGFDYKTMTESECVARLMEMYQELTHSSDK